jgi:hypothetical protein
MMGLSGLEAWLPEPDGYPMTFRWPYLSNSYDRELACALFDVGINVSDLIMSRTKRDAHKEIAERLKAAGFPEESLPVLGETPHDEVIRRIRDWKKE